MEQNFCFQKIVSFFFFFFFLPLLAGLSIDVLYWSYLNPNTLWPSHYQYSLVWVISAQTPLLLSYHRQLKVPAQKKCAQPFIYFWIHRAQSAANFQYFSFICCLSSHHSHSPSLISNIPLKNLRHYLFSYHLIWKLWDRLQAEGPNDARHDIHKRNLKLENTTSCLKLFLLFNSQSLTWTQEELCSYAEHSYSQSQGLGRSVSGLWQWPGVDV